MATWIALAVSAALTACSHEARDDSATLATVNGERITQAQLDGALRLRAPAAASMPAADLAALRGRTLQQLVEERLADQQAAKAKLDRNPGVAEAVDLAREQALARLYLERIADAVPRPAAADVRAYYDAHPERFAKAQAYTLRKVDVAIPPAQAEALRRDLEAATTPDDVLARLRARGLAFQAGQSEQGAESLGPLLARVQSLPDGGTLVVPTPGGLAALTVLGRQPRPVSAEAAAPAIEQALWNERKRAAMSDKLRALRAAAHVEYLGKFAGAAPAAAAGASAAASR